MKNKTKTLFCHICGTLILTDKGKVKCNNCGNDYTFKKGKFFRENVYSKMYGSKG